MIIAKVPFWRLNSIFIFISSGVLIRATIRPTIGIIVIVARASNTNWLAIWRLLVRVASLLLACVVITQTETMD